MIRLEKPYTELERLNFIVEYNHRQGLTIEETETALVAKEVTSQEVDVNMLTMTALDLVQLIMKAGVSAETIRNFLDSHAELDLMLKCCKDVYCGVVRQKLPIIIGEVTITDDMVVKAFKDKYEIQ